MRIGVGLLGSECGLDSFCPTFETRELRNSCEFAQLAGYNSEKSELRQ